MCSARGFEHGDLPTGQADGSQVGGGLDPVGHDPVVHAVQVTGGHTVDDHRGRADPLDVRPHADEEPAQIDDLRLPRRVVERRRPLGQRRRHHQVLGGADAREVQDDVRRPAARRRPPPSSCSAPHREAHTERFESFRCMSIGREPKSSPPGRAEAGPTAAGQERARAQRWKPACAAPDRSAPRSPAPPGWSAAGVRGLFGSRSLRTPSGAQQLPHELDVDDARARWRASYSPSARMAAAISLSTEFLAPPTVTVPANGPRRAHGDGTHPVSMLGPMPRLEARWSGVEADPSAARSRAIRPGPLKSEAAAGPFAQDVGPFSSVRAAPCRPRR